MPLHLLSKKSWNVYSATNKARVARDEAIAEAAARDAELERKNEASNNTIKILRDRADQDKQAAAFRESKLQIRKRKRLPGEDDTTMDLRYAKERSRAEERIKQQSLVKLKSTISEDSNAPITDRRGNIDLFPKSRPKSEVDKERERQKASEQSLGTHLKGSTRPWYQDVDQDGVDKDSGTCTGTGTRHQRQTQMVASADPLTFMKRAQSQLKEVQRERDEREQELSEFHKWQSYEVDRDIKRPLYMGRRKR